MHQTPVAVPDRRVRRRAARVVVRIVPEERLAIQGRLGIAQDAGQAHPVDLFVVGRIPAGTRNLEHCRVHVHGNHGLVADRPRGRHAGPEIDRGRADAAFVRRSLARSQRIVLGRVPHASVRALAVEPPVVAREHNDRLARNPQLVELRPDATDAAIQGREHAGIGRVAVSLGRVRAIPEPSQIVGLCLDRRVNRVVREVEQEWLVSEVLEDAQRLVRQPVGEVVAVGPSFRKRIDSPVGALVGMEVAAGGTPFVASHVPLEPVAVRREVHHDLGLQPRHQVPLPDMSRPIALDSEGFSQRGMAMLEPHRPVRRLQLGTDPVLTGNPVRHVRASRIEPGQQGRAGRRADRAGRVAVSEPHAVGSKAVYVRRLVEVAPIAAEIRPAEIVDQEDQEVRPGRSGILARRGRTPDKQGNSRDGEREPHGTILQLRARTEAMMRLRQEARPARRRYRAGLVCGCRS